MKIEHLIYVCKNISIYSNIYNNIDIYGYIYIYTYITYVQNEPYSISRHSHSGVDLSSHTIDRSNLWHGRLPFPEATRPGHTRLPHLCRWKKHGLNVNAGRAVLNEHFGQPFWDRRVQPRKAPILGRNGTKQAASSKHFRSGVSPWSPCISLWVFGISEVKGLP